MIRGGSICWFFAGLLFFVFFVPLMGIAAGDSNLLRNDFIYRCVCFLILGSVVFFVLRQPVKSGLKNRVESIKKELADLEDKRDRTYHEYGILENRLTDIKNESEKILEDYRQQGEREYKKILDNAKHLAERVKTQALSTIEQETVFAKNELRKKVADLSAKVAEDLLKKNINSDDQTRLVGEYLTKVQREV